MPRQRRCFRSDRGAVFAGTEIHTQVARAAQAAGAGVIDLLPIYRGLRWEILVVDGADDEHPNEVAHRIASQAIARAADQAMPRSGTSVDLSQQQGPARPGSR
jgi:hypothetical protein